MIEKFTIEKCKKQKWTNHKKYSIKIWYSKI
jgi:hypothetical protein